MKSYNKFMVLGCLLLVGCNTPTPSSELVVPRVSSAPYENLSCAQLAIRLEKMNNSAQELAATQDGGSYMMHADIPFMGTGDTMGTIELVKLKAKINAIHRVYERKECSSPNF